MKGNAMTDENVANFPPPKPTIAEILIEGATTDQPEMDMLMRVAEHHPKATREEFEAAVAAAQDALAGSQEAPRPTAPAYRVVDRIVRQTFKAAVESGEKPTHRSLINAQAAEFSKHPSHPNLVSWLACWKLEDLNDELAEEYGIYLDYTVGSPEVEATQEDLDYEPPEN
jgi:hypothetical protein